MTAPDLYHKLNRLGFKLKVEGGQLMIAPVSQLTPELREALKEHRGALLGVLTVSRLPWQLEHLVCAAVSGQLPETVQLPDGLVSDLNGYVMGWACSYLTGDREESLRRLWNAHGLWERSVN